MKFGVLHKMIKDYAEQLLNNLFRNTVLSMEC